MHIAPLLAPQPQHLDSPQRDEFINFTNQSKIFRRSHKFAGHDQVVFAVEDAQQDLVMLGILAHGRAGQGHYGLIIQNNASLVLIEAFVEQFDPLEVPFRAFGGAGVGVVAFKLMGAALFRFVQRIVRVGQQLVGLGGIVGVYGYPPADIEAYPTPFDS